MFYKVSSFIVLAAASIALTFGFAGCSKTNTPDTSAQSQPAQTDQSQQAAATDNLAPTDGTQATYANTQQHTGKSGAAAKLSAACAGAAHFFPIERCSRSRRTRTIPITTTTPNTRIRVTASPCFRHSKPRRHCRNIRSLPSPAMATCGRPDIGAMLPRATSGYPAHGRMPPQVGFLWTPGYWGFSAGLYSFNYGSWGPYVGYYGGINYGFGYGGIGYQGGYWSGNRFNYNRSVNNVNITNVNVYNRNITNTNMNRASYNGPEASLAGRCRRKPPHCVSSAFLRCPRRSSTSRRQHRTASSLPLSIMGVRPNLPRRSPSRQADRSLR